MHRKATMALAVAAALGLPHAATAQTQDELRTLREQIRQLDRRVTDAEQAAIQASSRPASESAMNPAVSVILNGIYSNLSQDPSAFRIYGFTVKAGRFFSGVGYQNQIHAHAWDFTDAPLANKVFLGNQLNEDGVQLKWVAPTDTYFDVGVEVGRGRQFPAAAGPAGPRNKNGVGSSNFFAHVGGDLGTGVAWQTGVSYLSTSPQDRTFDTLDSAGAPVTDSFTGKSRLWVLDGILKWAPNYNPTYTNFKLQGEFFRRRENGDLTFDSATTGGFASQQSGWYLQGVYQFVPMWRVGYRYDRLDSGTTSFSTPLNAADFPILAAYNPTRHTVMVDWSPSEFSRIRLQAASDKSRSDATDHQVFLQYIVSLGAHGAHKF